MIRGMAELRGQFDGAEEGNGSAEDGTSSDEGDESYSSGENEVGRPDRRAHGGAGAVSTRAPSPDGTIISVSVF